MPEAHAGGRVPETICARLDSYHRTLGENSAIVSRSRESRSGISQCISSYVKADNATMIPLVLWVFMGGGDHLPSGDPLAPLSPIT